MEPDSTKRQVSESPEELPNITKIKTTSDGQHVVIVTAEDKVVRVFEISSDGQLNLLSQR